MKARRKLGQHFLRDPAVLRELSELVDAPHSAGVLEIGPGEGALTAFLVAAGKPIVALDKDPRAIVELQKRFGERVLAVEGDALSADLTALLPSDEQGGRLPVVAGNLPYNVGSAIFTRLLGLGTQVARMVVMLQREVAQRIVAHPGTKAYGVPSVVTALTARAWLVREVPPAAFRPRPKVHSAVIFVEPLEPSVALPGEELRGFGGFLARVFQARRKVLSNALPDPELAQRIGLDLSQRPEQLTPEQLLALYRASGEVSGSPR